MQSLETICALPNKESNTCNYPLIEVDRIERMLRDLILVKWEEANPDLLKGLLVRPETHRGMHYTGLVLKCGSWCKYVEVGTRLIFDRFGNFDKYFDEKWGRIAIMSESKIFRSKHEPFTKVPLRSKAVISSPHEGGFDFNA